MAYTAADLQMVERHILQGEKHIIQQEELIGRLRRHNLPTGAGEELLEEFRSTLQQHWQHRAIMIESLTVG